MGIVRTYLLVFILGWGFWLWMDKEGPAHPQQPPAPSFGGVPGPGYPSYPGPPPAARPLPPGDGDLLQDLQYGVDLIKRHDYGGSFAFLWPRQSWILAGLVTLLIAFVSPGVWRMVGRFRRHRSRRQDT